MLVGCMPLVYNPCTTGGEVPTQPAEESLANDTAQSDLCTRWAPPYDGTRRESMLVSESKKGPVGTITALHCYLVLHTCCFERS